MLSSCASAVRLERDDTGRSVAVPDRVHRVVSLAPNITNTVYALGAESDLVGITNFTFYPPEAARQKPSVGEVIQPSLEKIVALHLLTWCWPYLLLIVRKRLKGCSVSA